MHFAIPTRHPDPSVYAGPATETIDCVFAVDSTDTSVAQGRATEADRSGAEPDWVPL